MVVFAVKVFDLVILIAQVKKSEIGENVTYIVALKSLGISYKFGENVTLVVVALKF